jgi:hypothetical protein
MKKLIILSPLSFVFLLLVSCGQDENTNVQTSAVKALKPKSENIKSKSDLEYEFTRDAQEYGRLLCEEKNAADSDDWDRHNEIEADKLDLKYSMSKKYKQFAGIKYYDDLYKYHVIIGKKRAGCRG